MKIALMIVAAIVIGLLLFARLVEPPHQLNIINSLTPGDRGVSEVASGVVFDKATGLKLNVWAPDAKSDTKRPVLIFYYGGGWANGERDHYNFVGKAYAAKGVVVVLPDYRKVPKVLFPAFNQDGAAAARWVQDNIATYGGDPARVTMSGHSAGAYIAMMLTLDPHYLRDAGVAPGFVRATVGIAGAYDFLPFDSKRSINAMRAWPRPNETQPIFFASKAAPPIMVLTGTEDDTVKPRNAMNLSRRLHELGTVVEFKAYPAFTHEHLIMAISKPFRGKGAVLEDSSRFLLAHSKAR